MKTNKEKFKQFVIEELKDYDEWREASPDGYAEIITDEAVKLFCQPAVRQMLIDFCQSQESYNIHISHTEIEKGVDDYLKSINFA